MSTWQDLLKKLTGSDDQQENTPQYSTGDNVGFVASPYEKRPWDVNPEDLMPKASSEGMPFSDKINPNGQMPVIPEINENKPQENPLSSSSKLKQTASASVKGPNTLVDSIVPSEEKKAPTEDEHMRAVLNAYKNNLADANLARALDQGVSTAFKSVGAKPDEEKYKNDIEQAKLPIEILEKQKEANKEKNLTDPSSRRSQLTRDMARQYLASAGLTNLASKITDDMPAEQVDSLTKGMFKDAVDTKMRLMGIQEQAASRREIAEQNRKLSKANQLQAAESQVFKLAEKMKNDLDADKGRTGNFGQISNKVQSAERMEGLIGAFKDGNLPPAQVEELSLGLANMLAGTGGTSRAQVEALVPHSAVGNAAELKNWLFNEPGGANQQKFVEAMAHTIGREKEIANNQLNKIRSSRLPLYKELKEKSPELYQDILTGYGMTKDASKENKAIDDRDRQAIEWAKANSKDPRAQQILKLHGM